ncbi:MAG: pyridoxamine 5'-phosphate oxidase [Chitinophagaceae bacterium]
MSIDIAAIRTDYTLQTLSEHDVHQDPLIQFEHWFQNAVHSQIEDVNAMTLCTVDSQGKPHGRIVLLKGLEEESFIFFTNYLSHKGQEIHANPFVSLVFYWKELQRQVRIEGCIQKISEQASNNYFQSRPRESQVGAWASLQSETLSERQILEKRFEEISNTHANKEIARPAHWGGYAVAPSCIEFWQGRANRLHDRIMYKKVNADWRIERLYP